MSYHYKSLYNSSNHFHAAIAFRYTRLLCQADCVGYIGHVSKYNVAILQENNAIDSSAEVTYKTLAVIGKSYLNHEIYTGVWNPSTSAVET